MDRSPAFSVCQWIIPSAFYFFEIKKKSEPVPTGTKFGFLRYGGASLNQTIGTNSNEVRREIITIVDKQEYRALMDYIRKVDPKAFVTVYAVSEMRYQPKKW